MTRPVFSRTVVSALVCLYSGMAHPQALEDRFRFCVDSIYRANPRSVGIMIHVESPRQKISWTYATGYSNKATKEKISAGQPALIASNTKTYVSAAILKLVELGKIKPEQTIDQLIDIKTRDLLLTAGYKTKEITLKQLLSHTSGIKDYVNDAYVDFVNIHREHLWTRDEQIELAMKNAKPLAEPGDTFVYADVNYLLLTEVIEKCTNKNFCQAMSGLLDLKDDHLNKTWFVNLEKTPKHTEALVHQYWEKYNWDSYDLNPSWDLYGGGGMAATTTDLAMFFQLLFDGKIVHNKRLLAMMCSDVPSKGKTNYCLGIRKLSIAGLTGYYHGGFWGTGATYFPELDASVSIFVLEKSERDISVTICANIATALKEAR